jgi:hypothetical protein
VNMLEQQKANKFVLHSFWACQIHANSKLVGAACEGVGRKLIDSLACYCRLMRTCSFRTDATRLTARSVHSLLC